MHPSESGGDIYDFEIVTFIYLGGGWGQVKKVTIFICHFHHNFITFSPTFEASKNDFQSI